TEVAAGECGEQIENLASEFTLPLPVTSGVLDVGFKTAYGGQQMTKQVRPAVALPLHLHTFSTCTVLLRTQSTTHCEVSLAHPTCFSLICLQRQLVTRSPILLRLPMELGVLLREKRNDWYTVNLYYLANYVKEIPFLVSVSSSILPRA
ncbi:unnamed protein product, partial [Ixodes persulcatus]